jgi:ketosteroid isomerase-like protein
MKDIIPPAVAREPVEAVEIVSLAISDGDLEAAFAQYEHSAILRVWRGNAPGDADLLQGPAVPHADAGDARDAADGLRAVMDLRLPLALRVLCVVPAGDLALVLSERRISGLGPDCERVELTGDGAAIVRRQTCGGWRIAADAWRLAGAGGPGAAAAHGPSDSP